MKMLCIIESWSITLLGGPDKEENRVLGGIPHTRQHARTIAIELSRNNIYRNYAIATWNKELQEWVNYDVFNGGHEISE